MQVKCTNTFHIRAGLRAEREARGEFYCIRGGGEESVSD